jgi:RNA polymerase sigma-70 factor (ECF subfamily)
MQSLRSPTDAELIREARADPACFVALFDRHYAAIYRFLQRRVGANRAEDLASEVFLRGLEMLDRYDARWPDARPWLYGIATNLVRRARRDEFRQMEALSRLSSISLVESRDQGDEQTSLMADVTRALRQLRPEERDVLLLYAWEALSYEEISRALDLPLGTVRSRLSRARSHLRTALGMNTPQESSVQSNDETRETEGGGNR